MDNEKFKELFTVDPIPATIKTGDTLSSNLKHEKQHKFNISNGQLIENGIVVDERKTENYLQEVTFLFYDTLKASEIPYFLDYHYNNAKDKAGLLSFIKYDLWERWPLTKNEPTNDHRKSIVSEWLQAQKPPQQKKEPLSLESIFSDNKQLTKLVNLLIEKGFVTMESGSPVWTGIKSDNASGKGLQLVALTEVCEKLYKRKTYEQKELYYAWTTYFNYSIAQNMFSDSKRPPKDSPYHNLFNNLLTSL